MLGQTALKAKGDALWYDCSSMMELGESYFCYLFKKSNMDQKDKIEGEKNSGTD